MKKEISDKINNEIKNNEVCLFMKGTPDQPQCGFSLAVSNLLKHLDVKFKGINVLEDNEVREGIKKCTKKTNYRKNLKIKKFLLKKTNSLINL